MVLCTGILVPLGPALSCNLHGANILFSPFFLWWKREKRKKEVGLFWGGGGVLEELFKSWRVEIFGTEFGES